MSGSGLTPTGSHPKAGPSAASEDAAKVSAIRDATKDSNPVSEDSHSQSKPATNATSSEMNDMSAPYHSSVDSSCDPDPSVTDSFLSFSMSGSTPNSLSSSPMACVSSFVAISMTTPSVSPAPRLAVSRLAPHRSASKYFSVPEQIQKHIKPFILSKEQLLHVKESMLAAIERGLKKVQGGSVLPMATSCVSALPDGTERGDFLGLELSQIQVKVSLLRLKGEEKQQAQMKTKTFAVTEKIHSGTGEQLFEFLAECLGTFLDGIDCVDEYFPLGFSFPFCCQHISLNQCKLISWTKDFRCSGVEGQDVAQMLQEAINLRCKDFHIEVIAVVNDSVATMLSCCSEEQPCEIGLVIDAGSNCSYMEEAYQIAGMKEDEGRVCLSTEWGCFGNAGELDDLLTEYDLSTDKTSFSQSKCRFEKLISSWYACEMLRLILADLSEKGELFNGVLTPALLTRGKLEHQDILDILDDKMGLAKTKNFLLRLGLVTSNQDCFHVQYMCQMVFTRSASLCAAGLAALVTHIRTVQCVPSLKIAIAVEGTLCKSQRQYCEILHQTLKLLAPECTITFVPSEGGSSVGAAMVTAAAMRLRNQHQQVSMALAPLRLSLVDLERVQNLMRQEMEKGLSKELHSTSSVRMLPSFVRNLPNGSERGDFLALDLGGTNFRVLLVQVKGQEEGGVSMTSEIYGIPPEVSQSTGTKLFDHIVSCIVDFQTKNGILGSTLPLGFTFSFPCSQLSLDKGVLLSWTKGFSASDCEGEDVVQLLRQAVERRQLFNLDVVALVNDTVGTMMSCAYVDPKCEIGLIVGTGCNACYMEEMQNVGTLEGNEGRMCINTEWGAFGDNGCLDHFITPFDKKVDASSINCGRHKYEKLISGMYLGEIVRYILLELTARKVLFRGQDSPVLQTKGIFPTKFLTDIEIGTKGQRQVCAILEEKGLNASLEDAQVVKEVCQAVSSRAAKLCGAGIAAIVEKIKKNRNLEKMDITVGVDGTLYKMHSRFSKLIQETVAQLIPDCHVKFLLSEDGSGKGAALIAATACRENTKTSA